MDLFSTYFSSSFLEPCPKLVLSDHSPSNERTNTQLAYDFLLHRRKLMMSIYHELRALYNFHSTSRVFPLQTIARFTFQQNILKRLELTRLKGLVGTALLM